MYDVTDVILFPDLSPEVTHKYLIAEMTCNFAFKLTRKLSLSGPIRFGVMWSSLVLHVYVYLLQDQKPIGDIYGVRTTQIVSYQPIQFNLTMPFIIETDIRRLPENRLRHYDVKLALPYITKALRCMAS